MFENCSLVDSVLPQATVPSLLYPSTLEVCICIRLSMLQSQGGREVVGVGAGMWDVMVREQGQGYRNKKKK